MSPLPPAAARLRPWCAMAAFAAIALAAGIGPAVAQAPNSIDALSISKASSGRTVVKFTLKSPLANPPAGFSINNPPRIALDFPDTGNGLVEPRRKLATPRCEASMSFKQEIERASSSTSTNPSHSRPRSRATR